MEYKEIKKLMDEMGNSKLSEMEIEFEDGVKIKMKKDNEKIQPNMSGIQNLPIMQQPAIPVAQTTQEVKVNNTNIVEHKENEKSGKIVKSPMVGTFYSKSSPDSEPFVKLGSKVKKGDTLCIIEAMKLMNEIESEYDGEIVEILVKDEEMVDYGKPLFIIN